MNDSVFNPDEFLDQTTDQEGSTYMTPCPAGEFRAVIADDVKFREEESRKTGKKLHLADVFWRIEDPEVEAALQRKPVVRQSVFIDLKVNPSTGRTELDFGEGKNVGLNRIRDAVGQNRAGMPWSPRMLKDQMATVVVTQRNDENDQKIIYNDIKRVGALV
jgi:hypothetical protein